MLEDCCAFLTPIPQVIPEPGDFGRVTKVGERRRVQKPGSCFRSLILFPYNYGNGNGIHLARFVSTIEDGVSLCRFCSRSPYKGTGIGTETLCWPPEPVRIVSLALAGPLNKTLAIQVWRPMKARSRGRLSRRRPAESSRVATLGGQVANGRCEGTWDSSPVWVVVTTPQIREARVFHA